MSIIRISFLVLCALSTHQAHAVALTLMGHDSFVFPDALVAQFEQEHGVELTIVTGGDAGSMLNKLILTKASPIADVVFGIDSTLGHRATSEAVFADIPATYRRPTPQLGLPPSLVAITKGYVNLNYSLAAFTDIPLPQSLAELTQSKYRGMLAVQHPGASSTGFAFLLATIRHWGEEGAFMWWKQMRHNGVHIAVDWTGAYYKLFSQYGGPAPMVVSYATSPAAEVFYGELEEPVTANLYLQGGVLEQVEGVGIVAGSAASQAGAVQDAALALINFMSTGAFQEQLQTTMWMLPTNPQATIDPALRGIALPDAPRPMSGEVIDANHARWVQLWVDTMIH